MRSEKISALKFVPGDELPSLDLATSSFDARCQALMMFDTLYGRAGAEQSCAARPQMVAGHTIENASHSLLAFPGWPNREKIEALRDQWLETPDVTAQRQIAAAIRAQAFVDVPYCALVTYYHATAFHSDLTVVLDGQAILWNVRRRV